MTADNTLRLEVQGHTDNGSDDGRAKNRRVEIADPRCSPKGN
jgi:flagellar motor protein MotB